MSLLNLNHFYSDMSLNPNWCEKMESSLKMLVYSFVNDNIISNSYLIRLYGD